MSEFISEAIGIEDENKSFENIMNNVNGNFDYLNEKIDVEIENIEMKLISEMNSRDIVFGTYTGDGAAERFIDLGFTPTAVEVYSRSGIQGCGNYAYGGLALKGFPCKNSEHNIIEIVQNGFKVFDDIAGKVATNGSSYGTYFHFKAYKGGSIVEVS